MGVAKTPVGASEFEVAVEGADDDVRSLTAGERVEFLAWVEKHRGDKDFSVNRACRAVGVRRKDVRGLFDVDGEFLEDYRTARGYGAEQIIGQMVKLAIEGVEEPIASGGQIVGVKRVWSDRLLQTMFNGLTEPGKAMLAGKLGLEISGPGGGPIKVQAGVALADVAAALREAGVDLAQLAGPAGELVEGEIMNETDEPIEEGT